MKGTSTHLIAVLCYVCGAACFGYTAYVCAYDVLSMRGIVLLCTLVVLSFLLGTLLRCRMEKATTQKRRLVRLFLFICFFLYSIILCNQLFLSEMDGFLMENSLIPTRTVWQYYHAYDSGAIALSILLAFVFTNMALFAPMGFFLPVLFRALQKSIYYYLVLSIVIFGLEALLFFLNIQALNTDRAILRLLGASLVYLMCNTRLLRSLMYRGHMQRRRRY